MDEIGLHAYVNTPTPVYGDNKQANNLWGEDLVTAGNMYFRTGFHYNKEAVEDGYVTVQYTNTEENVADITTKSLASNKVKTFKPMLCGYVTPFHH